MVCRKSIQFCKTIIHRKRTKEKRKNKKEGKERERNTTHSFSLSSLPLYLREHFTSAQLSSAQLTSPQTPTQQPTHQSQNVHNRRLLHSPTPHPIPPPLHPLLPLLHHTNHHHHHSKTQTKPHLGRNFPLNSMDNSPFTDNSPMHEFQQ